MSWLARNSYESRLPLFGLLLILTTGLAAHSISADEGKDFARIFGRSYEKAVDFIRKQDGITEMFRASGISPEFAWSIVFPELIRWSALSNIIETSNLEVLYVQFGRGYSDCSVGRFQMKPSFAEMLEGDFHRLCDPVDLKSTRIPGVETSDSISARRARVNRLNDMEGQAVYLMMFIRVVESLHAERKWTDMEEKLKFFAAAYNAGYRLPAARLEKEMKATRFHLGLFSGPPYYSYTEISLDYFRRRHGT